MQPEAATATTAATTGLPYAQDVPHIFCNYSPQGTKTTTDGLQLTTSL